MKKILAYSFLYIVLFGFLYSFSNDVHAQYPYVPNAGTGSAYDQKLAAEAAVRKQILDSRAVGYFTPDGKQLVEDNSKNPAAYDFYYKTDGNGMLLQYATGDNKVADDFLLVAGSGKAQMNDSLRSVFIKNKDGTIAQTNDTNGDHQNDDLFVFTAAQKAGLISGEEVVGGYVNSMAKVINEKTFPSRASTGTNSDVGPTNFGTSEAVNAQRAADSQKTLQLTKEITDLKERLKTPGLTDGEKADIQAAIKEKEQERTALQEKIVKDRADITAAAAKNTPPSPNPTPNFAGIDLCVPEFNILGSGSTLKWDPKACLAALSNMGIQVASLPFTWSAGLLDYVTGYTIRDFGKRFGNGGELYAPVNNIWQLIKNICNLFFIVALIYIAIKTILQADGFQEKQRLINVIIFAFLINFSMFFTKIMIDVSNTASLQVFNVITQSKDMQSGNTSASLIAQQTTANAPTGAAGTQKTLADVFLANMQIQKFVTQGGGEGLIGISHLDNAYIFTYGLFTIIFILVATIVIAAIAGMITIRFVMLVLLLMTSPIAYIGSFVPSVIGTYSNLWWEKFKQNLIFLPVLMIMFYITMTFSQFVANIVKGNPNDYVSLIFTYIITIAMLVISLSVAQMTGGSAAAASWGTNRLRGMMSSSKYLAGAATFGTAARAGRRGAQFGGYLADKSGISGKVKSIANSNSLFARMTGASALARGAIKQAEKIKDNTFDVRNTGLGKSLGVGDGLKAGYSQFAKDEKALNEERLKYAKASIEEDGKAKAASAYNEALNNAIKDEESAADDAAKYKATIDDATEALKPANLSKAISEGIEKDRKEQIDQIAKIEKQMFEQLDIHTDSSGKYTDETKARAKTEHDRLEQLRSERNTKLADIGNDADKKARTENRVKSLTKEIKDVEDSFYKATDKLTEAVVKREGVVDALKRSGVAGKLAKDASVADIKKQMNDQVDNNKYNQSQKEIEYLKMLQRYSNGPIDSFTGTTAVYSKELQEQIRKTFKRSVKSKEEKEAENRIKTLKEALKEGEEKTEAKDDSAKKT